MMLWRSNKQNKVALSSAEFEYCPMTVALKKLAWLKNVILELRVGGLHYVRDNRHKINTIVHTDLQSLQTKTGLPNYYKLNWSSFYQVPKRHLNMHILFGT